MNCLHCPEKIPDWLDQLDSGALDEAARAELEAQLEACPDCAREWRMALEVRQTLRELPQPAAPRALRANVRVALRDEVARKEARGNGFLPRIRPFVWAGGTGMAVLTLWVATGGQLSTLEPSTQSMETSGVQSAPSDVETPSRAIQPKPATSGRSGASAATNVRPKPKLLPTPAAPNPIAELPAPSSDNVAPEAFAAPPRASIPRASTSSGSSRPRISQLTEPQPHASTSNAAKRNQAARLSKPKFSAPRASSTKPALPRTPSSTPPARSSAPQIATAPPRESRSPLLPAAPNDALLRSRPRGDVPRVAIRRAPDSQNSPPAPSALAMPLPRADASSTNTLERAGVTLVVAAPETRSLELESARGRSAIAEAAAPRAGRNAAPAVAPNEATSDAVIPPPQSNAPASAFRGVTPQQGNLAAKTSERDETPTRRVQFTLRSRVALEQVELRLSDAPPISAPLWRGDLAANTPVSIDAALPSSAKSPLRLRLEQNRAGARSNVLELSVVLPSP